MPTYTSTNVLTGLPMTDTTAFPAAAANANTNGLQLTLITTSRPIRTINVQVGWPALAVHTDTSKVVTLTLQDSADNSNWANLNPLTQVQLPGVASNGANADNYRMALPSHTQGYVRVRIDNPSGGPNITNKNCTTSLVLA